MNADQKPPYYCYAWMPVTHFVHYQLSPRKNETNIHQIDDGVGTERRIYCEHKGESILLYFWDKVQEKPKDTTPITFHITEYIRNGTVEFTLSSSDYETLKRKGLLIDPKRGNTGEELVVAAIYHVIKDLYHEHQYHEDLIDSDFFDMIVSKKKISITDPNNKFIFACFTFLERKFITNAEYLREMLWYINKNSIKQTDLLKSRHCFDDKCESILNYVFYYKKLQNSQYNRGYHTNISDEEFAQNNTFHQITLNIDNTIREIERLKSKNIIDMHIGCFDDIFSLEEFKQYNEELNRKLALVGTQIGIGGFVFAILSLGIGLFPNFVKDSCICVKILIFSLIVSFGTYFLIKFIMHRKRDRKIKADLNK